VADLTVVAVIVAQPGKEEVVRGALVALVPPTLQEQGCLSYALSESAAAPGTFVTVETWRAQADLDAHLGTPHVQAAFAAAGDSLAAAPAIHPLVPLAS
jgi:quinol monooxygenase YgiN